MRSELIVIRRILWVLLVFALLGPLIGLVVFALGAGALAVAAGKPDGAALAPFFLIYGLPFAHFFGLPWALIAGLAAALLGLMRSSSAGWIGLAGGSISFMAYMLGSNGAAREAFGPGFVYLALVVHVIPAVLCWWIVSRWASKAAVRILR